RDVWSRPNSRRALARFRVASVGDVPLESLKKVEAGRTPVCLAHAEDGNFYALNDVCTHEEFSLSDGELWDMDVECPQHGSRFNPLHGQATRLPHVTHSTPHTLQTQHRQGAPPPPRQPRHHVPGDARGRRSVRRGCGMSTKEARRLD